MTVTISHPPLLIWYARCPTLTALGLVANRGVLQREFLRENVALVSVRENSTPAVRQGPWHARSRRFRGDRYGARNDRR